MLVTLVDANGRKSPLINSALLTLPIPSGSKSLTLRADTNTGTLAYAKYSPTAVLAAGAQASGDGSRRFDLGGDEPIPCVGVDNLYFALDATGTADWNWVFTTD